MTIDLKALKKKGLKTARFEFSYNVSEDVMTLPDARFVGDAKVVANVEAFEDEAYVDGQVTYRFCAACARCLNPVTLERTADFDELFLSEYSTKKTRTCIVTAATPSILTIWSSNLF
ncbi:MAG: hypothetical protein ILP02_02605 [Clostridia bacterium]|nr:hypothetical protein [Clostridia bacterium]